MKITCDNCGAKYSIADEKVQGKVFKIRCKKCGESIVVRGDQQPAPAVAETETKVFDYAGYKTNGTDTPVWYVAGDDGAQQGPYSTLQMKEFLAQGNITTESFAWKDGFDDWKTVSAIPDIMAPADSAPAAASGGGLFDSAPAAASGGGLFDSAPAAASGGGLFDSAPAAASGGGLFDSAPAAASGGGLFDSAPTSDSGDIFSATAASPTSGGGLFSADTADAAAGQDLFNSSGSAGGGDLFGGDDAQEGGIFASTEAASPSPRVSAAQAMTGQRNENSVLFSLSNLQALASDAAPAAASPATGNLERKPGYASNEASGLIDIRAMASSLAAEAEKSSDVDDMLALGGGGFAPTLGAPVLTATHQGMNTGMKAAIIGGAVLLLAVLVVGGIIFWRSTGDKDKAALENQEKIALLMKQIEEMQKGGASVEALKQAQNQLAQAQGTQQQLAPGVHAMPDPKEEAKKEEEAASRAASSGTARRTTTTTSTPKEEASSTPSSGTTATAPKATSAAKTSELDALLGGGSTKKTTTAPKAAAPASGGDKLTREQVVSGMNAVTPSVRKCGAGKSGSISVRAVIAADGRVEQATPTGDFANTPEGACAARAVRQARFPRSSSSTTVTYPFRL